MVEQYVTVSKQSLESQRQQCSLGVLVAGVVIIRPYQPAERHTYPLYTELPIC